MEVNEDSMDIDTADHWDQQDVEAAASPMVHSETPTRLPPGDAQEDTPYNPYPPGHPLEHIYGTPSPQPSHGYRPSPSGYPLLFRLPYPNRYPSQYPSQYPSGYPQSHSEQLQPAPVGYLSYGLGSPTRGASFGTPGNRGASSFELRRNLLPAFQGH
ncbi:hypothetical protein B0I72DRAFT_139657 [Yarrowia lipolytica]|nr:hypothetical protein BKA91DRAFT_138508 [Yarrowia lipolytica]KAE8170834.1 hypothetical protein BKA90DRAFT_140206 [Yarrowia lipolytica]RDW26772.1 hypothetical protein B0I71DRAFT_130257 [Yarrowia lipolytica]RDW31514.1 hypothetical protein B0I72DRAFT_139657 [Yarrowia lipolytica]RDW36755.1 hypothetical protein B0I73DRAFT_136618 [Yarrowia lipolytica]